MSSSAPNAEISPDQRHLLNTDGKTDKGSGTRTLRVTFIFEQMTSRFEGELTETDTESFHQLP